MRKLRSARLRAVSPLLVVIVLALVFATSPMGEAATPSFEYKIDSLEQLRVRFISPGFYDFVPGRTSRTLTVARDLVDPIKVMLEITNDGSPISFALQYTGANCAIRRHSDDPAGPPPSPLSFAALGTGESVTFDLTLYPLAHGDSSQAISILVPETGQIYDLGYLDLRTPGLSFLWYLSSMDLARTVAWLSGIMLVPGFMIGLRLARKSLKNQRTIVAFDLNSKPGSKEVPPAGV